MAMMSGRGSGDKAGEASFTPEVPSGYLKHSEPAKISEICHFDQAFDVKIWFDISKIDSCKKCCQGESLSASTPS